MLFPSTSPCIIILLSSVLTLHKFIYDIARNSYSCKSIRFPKLLSYLPKSSQDSQHSPQALQNTSHSVNQPPFKFQKPITSDLQLHSRKPLPTLFIYFLADHLLARHTAARVTGRPVFSSETVLPIATRISPGYACCQPRVVIIIKKKEWRGKYWGLYIPLRIKSRVPAAKFIRDFPRNCISSVSVSRGGIEGGRKNAAASWQTRDAPSGGGR